MRSRSYYCGILKVDENASVQKIRLAYKKLVFTHPDKNPGDIEKANHTFSAVHEAYETLTKNPIQIKIGELSLLARKQLPIKPLVEALYKQFPDQLATANFNEKEGLLSINLSGLENKNVKYFKNQIDKIITRLGPGRVRATAKSDFQIEIGFDKVQNAKYLYDIIEKVVEKAYIDSLESAKEFLRMGS